MPSLDFRSVHRALAEQGWRVEQTQMGHYKAAPPDRTRTIVHFSESNDPRAIRNTITNLKKSGFAWNDAQPSRAEPEKPPTMKETGAMAPPAPSVAPALRPTLDDVFARLREAREMLALTDDDLRDARYDLELAQGRADAAAVDREKAAESLRAAKAAFDETFSAG